MYSPTHVTLCIFPHFNQVSTQSMYYSALLLRYLCNSRATRCSIPLLCFFLAFSLSPHCLAWTIISRYPWLPTRSNCDCCSGELLSALLECVGRMFGACALALRKTFEPLFSFLYRLLQLIFYAWISMAVFPGCLIIAEWMLYSDLLSLEVPFAFQKDTLVGPIFRWVSYWEVLCLLLCPGGTAPSFS